MTCYQSESSDEFRVPVDVECDEDKTGRVPIKHRLQGMLNATHPLVREWAQAQIRGYERAKQRRRQIEAAIKREKREEARTAPLRAIENEARDRLKVLRRATKYGRGDKFLEQIVGREDELTTFWKVGKLLELQLGQRPTDAEWGAFFAQARGLPEPLTKSQARGRRQNVEKLEQCYQFWLRCHGKARS